jgi:hypothetical protein
LFVKLRVSNFQNDGNRKDDSMRSSISGTIWKTAVIAMLAIAIWGCGTSGDVHWGKDKRYENPPPSAAEKRGPPDWAPAHGYRAKHRYLYFPSCSVYYDTDRSIYFYIEDGHWVISADLPGGLSVRLGTYVVLEMDTDKPYRHHGQHQKKYPPGRMKEKHNARWSRD